jgi:hypothetical protein
VTETTAAQHAIAKAAKKAARRLEVNPGHFAAATTPEARFVSAYRWFTAAFPGPAALDRAATFLRDLAVEADTHNASLSSSPPLPRRGGGAQEEAPRSTGSTTVDAVDAHART